jgi:hypothetical protein
MEVPRRFCRSSGRACLRVLCRQTRLAQMTLERILLRRLTQAKLRQPQRPSDRGTHRLRRRCDRKQRCTQLEPTHKRASLRPPCARFQARLGRRAQQRVVQRMTSDGATLRIGCDHGHPAIRHMAGRIHCEVHRVRPAPADHHRVLGTALARSLIVPRHQAITAVFAQRTALRDGPDQFARRPDFVCGLHKPTCFARPCAVRSDRPLRHVLAQTSFSR